MASVGFLCRLLVRMVRRGVGGVELLISEYRMPLFDTIDFDGVNEAFTMVVVGSGQRVEVLAAGEVSMVFMASGGVLRGLPVAAVLEFFYYYDRVG